MAAKKTSSTSDVVLRLAGIKHLFVTAETKQLAKAFRSTDGGPDAKNEFLEEIPRFAEVTKGVEAALTSAMNAFRGYPPVPLDGDVRGAAAELVDDVRALTNVALGLSPPSRAFYDNVLGGLVNVEHVTGAPPDAGSVPYPALRVSLNKLEKQAQNGGGTNGHAGVHPEAHEHGFAGSLNPAVVGILVRLQNHIVTTYLEKIVHGSAKVVSAVAPLVHEAWEELESQLPSHMPDHRREKLKGNLKTLHQAKSPLYPTDVNLVHIESHFVEIYKDLT